MNLSLSSKALTFVFRSIYLRNRVTADHVTHEKHFSAMILQYRNTDTTQGSQRTKKTTNVSKEVKRAVNSSGILDPRPRHLKRDSVPHLVWVGQDTSTWDHWGEARFVVDDQISHIYLVVIQVKFRTSHHFYRVGPLLICNREPLGWSNFYNSLLLELMWNETPWILEQEDVLEFHPIRDLLIRLASSLLRVTQLEDYHEVLSRVGVVVAEDIQVIVIDAPHLWPINAEIALWFWIGFEEFRVGIGASNVV